MNWDKTIFLAHASEDKPRVRKIFSELKNNGLEPWLDEFSLKPGSKWEDEIKKAIRKSRFFLAILSKNSIRKNGFVQKEFRLALSELEMKSPSNTYFIPLLLDDTKIPDISVGTINLGDYHAIKLQSNESLKNLIKYFKQQVKIYDKISYKNAEDNLEPIKEKISNNKTKEAIEELLELIKKAHSEYYNNVLLLKSRLNQTQNNYNLGIIKIEDNFFNINKINYSLLEIIDLIDNKNI